MDYKKTQIIVVLFLVVCLGTILAVGASIKKENVMPKKNESRSAKYIEIDDNTKNIEIDEQNKDIKYYINLTNESGTLYQLDFSDDRYVKLHTEKSNDTFDLSNTSLNHEGLLTEEEFNKVKVILEFIKNKNNLNENHYGFIYDEQNVNIPLEDKNYVLEVLSAIENIIIKDETVNENTKKEIGNEILNNIIERLQLNINTNEIPAN